MKLFVKKVRFLKSSAGIFLVPLFLFLMLNQAQCDSFSEGGDVKGSCHYPESVYNGYCAEYVGDGYNTNDVEDQCASQGTFSIGECSTKNYPIFGTCIIEKDTLLEYHMIIDKENAAITSEFGAKTYCESTLGGFWVL